MRPCATLIRPPSTTTATSSTSSDAGNLVHMAPAQSKLARSAAVLTSMQTKGGAALVGTLFALLYLRRKLAQAAQDAQDKRASLALSFGSILVRRADEDVPHR